MGYVPLRRETMTDCTLTNLIHKFGIAAHDYWSSFTLFDGPEPMRMSYTKRCAQDMEDRLSDVISYVEGNYERKFDGA
jgi:hypothetical protein